MNTYKTIDIARIIGIHVNTVRLYEKCGLIPKPERLGNGYWVFTDLHIEQFRLARAALQVEVLQNGLRKRAVEFRLFQFDEPTGERRGGLHAGQLKSYIQLCLALSQMAKAVRSASPKPQQNENPKYAMRTWLLRLGFIGDEFKTARDILTRRLSGDASFRNGRAAA